MIESLPVFFRYEFVILLFLNFAENMRGQESSANHRHELYKYVCHCFHMFLNTNIHKRQKKSSTVFIE